MEGLVCCRKGPEHGSKRGLQTASLARGPRADSPPSRPVAEACACDGNAQAWRSCESKGCQHPSRVLEPEPFSDANSCSRLSPLQPCCVLCLARAGLALSL
eukprot:scaffold265339_cov37-Tisochrysis_lutea.AAC.3